MKIDSKMKGIPFKPYWNFCVGAGRANEGLRANWQSQLKKVVKECHFRYVRFHGLFHDDMFVYNEKNGKALYNFQYIDELFDALLEIGIKPFVELGFCPLEMASEKKTVFWWGGHGSPPNDYEKWNNLVKNFVQHSISRYGIDEVRTWYFEVWNEPNLHPFFTGTKSEYFELYKVSALAIKGIDKQLRVGGPATSNFVPDGRFDGEKEDKEKQLTNKVEDLNKLQWKGVWIEDFINYCSKENLPMDFLSTHPYPTDFALDGHGGNSGRSRNVDSTKKDLQWLRNIIDKSPFPEAEIHLTEWSSSPSSRDHSHDFLPAATFIVKTNLDSIGLVDSLSYWTFTDVFEEGGAGDSIFHGGFGMINFQGIVKPSFHAYRFLSYLGDEIMGSEEGSFISRDSKTGFISAIFYHYPAQMPSAVPMANKDRSQAEKILSIGTDEDLSIEITNLPPETLFSVEILDSENGSVMSDWKNMGYPEPPDRQQTEELRASAMKTSCFTWKSGKDGVLSINKNIKPWSIIMMRQKG
jgi:xylan 1,4-beta-xylosidase